MAGRLLHKKQPPAGGAVAVQYVPAATSFVHATADIYSGNGAYPIPGPKRQSAVSCLISGSWMAGHRQSVNTSDKHSHIMLLDPNIEIRDPYTGNGQATGADADAIVINGATLGATSSPWFFVVFSFVSFIPGLGRKKVVFLDQVTSFPSSVLLKDSFVDANGTALANHTMDQGAGWTVHNGTATIQSNQCTITNPTDVTADAGTLSGGNFSQANIDVVSVQAAGGEAGIEFRWSAAGNYWRARLSTTQLDLTKTVAGVNTAVSSTPLSLTVGTRHTLNLTASGSNLTLNVDGGNQITASDSFNSTASKHGLFSQSGGGPFANFQINQ